MKSYKSVAEVVDCLVDFHDRAALLARQTQDKGLSEKASLVLDCLYQHHIVMKEALAEYGGNEIDVLLDEPIDYYLNDSDAPEHFIAGFSIQNPVELEEAEKLALALGEYIVGLMGNIAGEASLCPTSVVNAVATLAAMEKNEQRKMFEAIGYIKKM